MSKTIDAFNIPRLKNIISSVVFTVFHETPIEITDISEFGEVNFTCAVRMHSQTVVVRVNPDEDMKRFELEKWASDLAIAKRVPTPKVIFVGEHEGVAVHISEYIDGVNGKIYQNKKVIWESLGRCARQIHNIPVKGFGEKMSSPKDYQFDGSWQQYVQYNIDSLTSDDVLISMGVLSFETSQRLKDIFVRILQTEFQFGLSHGDLSEKNTIIDSQEKVWLIDWGCTHAHIVPYFDFAAILEWNIDKDSKEFEYFLYGYGMKKEEFNEIYPQILDFSLLQATDKLRWAIDRKPEEIERFTKKLQMMIENRV